MGKPSLQIPPKAISGIWFSVPLLLLVLAICLIAVWAFWPGAGSSVSAAILGYPVYDGVLVTTIVTRGPFFVIINI